MATIWYDGDADPSIIRGRRVAVIGYGSQGHAHALNLTESGVEVTVGLRAGSASAVAAEEAGLRVTTPADAARPRTGDAARPRPAHGRHLPGRRHAEPDAGDALFFAHGFNIHFGEIGPPEDVDVVMVAPKGPGHWSAAPTPRGRVSLPARRPSGRHGKAHDLGSPMHGASVGPGPGCSGPPSPRRPRPTCSASR